MLKVKVANRQRGTLTNRQIDLNKYVPPLKVTKNEFGEIINASVISNKGNN